ncbi:galactose oxidase early set domain-containing protein [Aquimarina sp. RZ0]|uniref:galactose oxidase early set domain-containing protein n=1 Tax=Aquimarina sp. RZ0 TaxID=2607730 RepID=UPI00165EF252|nr:galactose oxidase early set domain-containing protein [Aquimarina sp. RZ0]
MAWNPDLIDTEILAVHAALIPSGNDGQILLFGGDEHWSAQAETQPGELFKKTRIFDLQGNNIISDVNSPDSDVFCAGHAFLADGRLLIGGGTSKWPESDHHDHGLDFLGHRRCWVFNAFAREWIEVKRMLPQPGREAEDVGGGRWYPTLTTLGNGDVIAFFGHLSQEDFRHRNTTPEIFNISANNWIGLPQMADPTLRPSGEARFLMYPRVFLLSDGNMFFATPMPTTSNEPSEYFCTFYNPTTGDYFGPNINAAPGWTINWDMPAVLLPLLPEENYRARVLTCGAANNHIIDLGATTPTWVQTAARVGATVGKRRLHSIAVILPTGQIAHVGGVNQQNPEDPVLEAEIYTPSINWNNGDYSGTDSWETKEAAQLARNYHSTALLMPDGRIWTAGGNTNAESGNPDGNANPDTDGNTKKKGIKKIEIYEPDYFSNAGRPELTSTPKSLGYNQLFTIECTQASNIQRVALIRNGSVTHGHDYDQRYVGLEFDQDGGDTLIVTSPPNGNVAPPGYYTLWVINDSGLPCQKAKFVRLAHQKCTIITDRSTFSNYEVDALLGEDGTAIFEDSLYLMYDNFIPSELNLPGGSPTSTLRFADDNSLVSGMSVSLKDVLYEDETTPLDIPQRITFVYNIRFTNNNAFSFDPESRNIRLQFDYLHHTCFTVLNLIKAPNPYMRDSISDGAGNYNPHWLSTDLRVFQIKEGGILPGTSIVHGNSASSPFTFLDAVLQDFDDSTENDSHPFLQISDDQQSSKLELARFVNGKRVYNYAIAKVRFRLSELPPDTDELRVFFRGFKTASSSMTFQPSTTYRRIGNGPSAIPLLGIVGNEVVTIPFFGTPRINTAIQSMNLQTDSINSKPFEAGGSTEMTLYFGCWLDINQTTPQFPIAPGLNNGPFVNRRSIQELIRGEHQCLVAEIHFLADSIPIGSAKPGNNDNLSQRNLAIVDSDNPGSAATHIIQHTFEIKPETYGKADLKALYDNIGAFVSFPNRILPDELMIHWHNIPRDSMAELTFSGIDVDEILELSHRRLSPQTLYKIDEQTISCKISDVTFIPMPFNRAKNIPALISIQLPDNVVKGQHYHATIFQISGRTRSVTGAFEVSIPVSQAPLLISAEIRKLSVLKHIFSTIPSTDHWYPIFQKYLKQISDRVDGFGGNANEVFPNPDGTGKNPNIDNSGIFSCNWQWIFLLIVALIPVSFTTIGNVTALAIGLTSAIVLLIVLYLKWCKECKPDRCELIRTVQLGFVVAAGVLGILSLIKFENEISNYLFYGLVLGILVLQFFTLFLCKCKNREKTC